MAETLLKITCHELCSREHIATELMVELVDYGIVRPIAGQQPTNWEFDTTSVHWLKTALRLAQDLEIDWLAVALVVDLMRQRESLQRENNYYQRQLQRFTNIT